VPFQPVLKVVADLERDDPKFPNGFTHQWRDMIRIFQIIVLIIKDWRFTGLLFSTIF
jgi:hypothetical protein